MSAGAANPLGAEVFISYAQDEDGARALDLADRLEAAGVSVWIADRSIQGAQNYGPEVVAAIDRCQVLVVLCSSASLHSEHVAVEVELAFEARRPRLPLRLDDTAFPDQIRYWLTGLNWIDVRGPAEEWLSKVLRALERLGVDGGVANEAGPPGPPDVVDNSATAPLVVPLPLRLRAAVGSVFAGRTAERTAVAETLKQVAAGEGRRVVLLGGEAGIGKTMLVSTSARDAHAEGAWVLYGRCDEELGIPYQPWVEALGDLVEPAPEALLQGHVDACGGELVALIPGLGARVGALSRPRSSEREDMRHVLFAAVVDLLSRASVAAPVVLVLDDLHWADRPSLQLLRHVVATSTPMRLAVLGTFRAGDVAADNPLADVLAALHREPGVERLSLRGLDDLELLGLLQALAGYEMNDEGLALRDALLGETDGNPFFVLEILRHLIETGAIAQTDQGRWVAQVDLATHGLPVSVREVIGQRVHRLGMDAKRVLSAAAVIGRDFDVALLGAVLDTGDEELLDVLDAAVGASVLTDALGTQGQFSFVHALIQRALYDELSTARRQQVHRRIGEALETLCGDSPGDRLGELAYHFGAAGTGVATKALDCAHRAGNRALELLAYEEAVRLYEMALDALEHVSPPPDRTRCELLVQLADANMRAGDVGTAQVRCCEASTLAARLGEPSLVVAAALTCGEANSRAALPGGKAEELLRDALSLADDDISRVRLQAYLGRALVISGKGEEGQALVEEALAAAREVGDFETLSVAFSSVLFTPAVPANLDHQIGFAREFTELARAEGDLDQESWALASLLHGSITIGELDEARAMAARQRDVTRQTGQPLSMALSLQVQTLLALGEGRFVEAEAMATEANEIGSFLSGGDAPGGYGVQLFSIRREQGRLDEARPIIEAIARLGREGATWRPALAVLYADLGLTDEAGVEVRHLVGQDLRAVPRDSLWAASLSYLADACAAVGDRDAAAIVYRELLPYRGLVVQVGYLLAAYGAADRYLGILAALLSRAGDAETHFEAALRVDTRAHMPVWVTHTQFAYGRFMASRTRREDLERSKALLHAALETAQTLGMATVAARATAELTRLPTPARPEPQTRS